MGHAGLPDVPRCDLELMCRYKQELNLLRTQAHLSATVTYKSNAVLSIWCPHPGALTVRHTLVRHTAQAFTRGSASTTNTLWRTGRQSQLEPHWCRFSHQETTSLQGSWSQRPIRATAAGKPDTGVPAELTEPKTHLSLPRELFLSLHSPLPSPCSQHQPGARRATVTTGRRADLPPSESA